MSEICSVKKFLNDRPIFYKKIDYERFPKAYASIKDKIPLKNVIQIIGTNGKGSTGRFLANAIAAAGFRVGHYTSPHVFRLNERIYLAGPGAVNARAAAKSHIAAKSHATENARTAVGIRRDTKGSGGSNFSDAPLGLNSNATPMGSNFNGMPLEADSAAAPVGLNFKTALIDLNFKAAPIGRDVSDAQLQRAHEFLQANLPAEFKDSLSYFEYLTLAAAVIFKECDYCVIEAGMGGEFDATSSFGRTLLLFTPIDTDHLGMLGGNLEQIARTKLITMQQAAILSDEMSEAPLRIARQIARQKGTRLSLASDFLDAPQRAQIAEFCARNNLPKFQISNLSLALAAMKFLNLKFEISQLPPLNLRGRMEALAPNLRVDVGHNELAARAISEIYAGKKIVLIYNSFADKDIAAVLRTLAPVLKRVEILSYRVKDRKLGGAQIGKCLDGLGIPHRKFSGEISADEEYLVFGSFYLAERFLKRYVKGVKLG